PGVWNLVAGAPGHHEAQRVWTVAPASPDTLTLVLSPVPPAPAPEPVAVAVVQPVPPPVPVRPPPAREPRLELGLGLGLAGAVALGIGTGLLIQHRRGYAHFEAAPNNAGFVAALSASTTGAALVGVGTGLAAAAATAGLAPARRLDRWLWSEVAAGGAVTLIGTAWYASEWQRVQRDLYDSRSAAAHDAGAQRRETAAAAVLGAGAGLMVGAGAALLTRTLIRLHGRRGAARHALGGGPGPLGGPGFQIEGRF
ncbi:MAG TPA: alpha/beta-hydrolase N-terminal domain-containing protein, partial [Nannocystis sp.]